MIPALLLLVAGALAAESAPGPKPARADAPAEIAPPVSPDAPDPGRALREALRRPELDADPQERHLALRRHLDDPVHAAWAHKAMLELVRSEPTHPSWRDTYARLLDNAEDVAVRAELHARRDAASIRQRDTRPARLEDLREAVAFDPDDVVARRLLAEALLLEGEPVKALAVLLQGPPDPAAAELRYLATLGSRALSGDPLERLAHAAGRADAPQDGVGAARVLEEAGYSAAAEVALQTHQGTPSTSPAELRLYCRLLLDRGETARAGTLLRALLRVDPDDAEARALLARAEIPWSPATLDLAQLRAALHRDPGNADLLVRWAELSLQAGHDPLRGLLYGAASTAPEDLDRVAVAIATARRARGDAARAEHPEQADREYTVASMASPERNPIVRVDRSLRLQLYRAHAATRSLARTRWVNL